MLQAENAEVKIADRDRLLREELPIKALRKRLTLSFVWVSLLIYLIAGLLSIVIFWSSLNASMAANVNRLLSDIQPSVRLELGQLTLKDWARNAEEQRLHIIHVVQLFDKQGRIHEEYGIPGLRQLCNGKCQRTNEHYSLRSKYVEVQNAGFLQVQVDTKQTDDAFNHFLITMLVLVPVVALIAGATGYVYCGYAVTPVLQGFQVLRRFVDDAGHELRTPVAVIAASVQTLEDAISSDQSVKELLNKVIRASQRLKSLSNGLIILASMESPELQLDRYKLDANTLLVQVCDDFQNLSEDKGVQLSGHVSSGGGSAIVLGNGDALQRMLSNLIENAIRYTAPGGKVMVSCSVHGQHVNIIVEDNGIGIPKDSLSHIFDRFYRVDKARTREQGGTGLGLSIVRAIVEAHSGTIGVSSTVGVGSKFKIQLPLCTDSLQLMRDRSI